MYGEKFFWFNLQQPIMRGSPMISVNCNLYNVHGENQGAAILHDGSLITTRALKGNLWSL